MDGNEGEPEYSEGEVFEENSQSAYQNNVPRQAENANFPNSMSLDLRTSMIDVDVIHPDTTQRAQSTIQPNLPDYEVFPTEIKNKT